MDGWYSTNILGNADGRNLMDPERAASKLSNKTKILDELLGYQVGERHDTPTHKVRIDYYPPRGDAKEAWDVIDILGLFDLPMSIRVNLQARDSILAAPMVLDLAQWMCSVQKLGRSGNVPELAFSPVSFTSIPFATIAPGWSPSIRAARRMGDSLSQRSMR